MKLGVPQADSAPYLGSISISGHQALTPATRRNTSQSKPAGVGRAQRVGCLWSCCEDCRSDINFGGITEFPLLHTIVVTDALCLT